MASAPATGFVPASLPPDPPVLDDDPVLDDVVLGDPLLEDPVEEGGSPEPPHPAVRAIVAR
jgi:hypothetical protein